MKSKMKMMMILPIIFAATVGLYGQSSENSKNTPSQKEMLQVKVTYLEEEKKIPNADVYFLYYDEATSTLVEKTANTGSGKTVNFQVPVTSGGASYAFVVFFSKEEVEKAKEALGRPRMAIPEGLALGARAVDPRGGDRRAAGVVGRTGLMWQYGFRDSVF